eukprot:SAG31_NODE_16369_length_711_cov_4.393791_1_plen_39_part_10
MAPWTWCLLVPGGAWRHNSSLLDYLYRYYIYYLKILVIY